MSQLEVPKFEGPSTVRAASPLVRAILPTACLLCGATGGFGFGWYMHGKASAPSAAPQEAQEGLQAGKKSHQPASSKADRERRIVIKAMKDVGLSAPTIEKILKEAEDATASGQRSWPDALGKALARARGFVALSAGFTESERLETERRRECLERAKEDIRWIEEGGDSLDTR